jgi:sulfate permease, SulP family
MDGQVPSVSAGASWRQVVRREAALARLLPTLSAGVVNGILVIVIQISLAAMIFSGDLSPFLARGIGVCLFGAVVLCAVVALTSSLPGVIALPQDGPAAVTALAAAAICAGMPASSSPEATFLTVLAAMGMSGLLTGLCFIVLGYFRLGDFVRYIPYSVVGGFLAGIGWLLVVGAMGVLTGTAIRPSTLGVLAEPGLLARWLPGVLFGAVLYFGLRRWSHFLLMPGMLVGGVGLFYLILFLTGTPLPAAAGRGLLIGPFPDSAAWQPPSLASLAQVYWPAVFGQLGKMAIIALISVLSLLLNATGLELVVRRDLDPNRELLATGVANAAAGAACAGPVGYVALSLSALGRRLGSDSRLVGLVMAGLCAAPLLLGVSMLSWLPRPVVGGLLFFIGLCFLVEWIYDAWFKLPGIEYSLVLLILVVVGALGFLQGVATGVMVALVLFVVNYSRIDVVKHELSGATCQSSVARAAPYRRLLIERGETICILKLHGYIFFGTANGLLERIRRRLEAAPGDRRPRFVVLDFRSVSGLDSSALNSFQKLEQMEAAQGFLLVFSGLPIGLQRQLQRGVYHGRDGGGATLRSFPGLDQAVEWCEDRLLAGEADGLAQTKQTLADRYGDAFFDSVHDDLMQYLDKQEAFEAIIEALSGHLEKRELEAGVCLMRQGDPAEGFYFVESGEVTVQLERPSGEPAAHQPEPGGREPARGGPIRLRTMGPGTVVGEMGLYLGYRASASAVTTRSCTVYHLSLATLQRIEETEAALAAKFHKFTACLLCERLGDTTRALQTLMDQ